MVVGRLFAWREVLVCLEGNFRFVGSVKRKECFSNVLVEGTKNVEYAVRKQYTFRLELCLYSQELSNVTEMYDLFGEISFSGPYGKRREKTKLYRLL